MKINHLLKHSFFLLIGMILATGTAAQGYHLKFNIKNFSDTTCYLAKYYGDKILVQDTTPSENGSFIFEGDSLLDKGMYVLAGQSNNKVIDLLIDDDQKFSVTFDSEKPVVENITFKGSKENEIFYTYVRFLNEKQKVVQELQKAYQSAESEKEKEQLRNQIMEINNEVEAYQNSFSDKHHGTFAAVFVKASTQVRIPDSLTSASKKKKYFYFRNHYWDHIPLSDNRILHTPFFDERWRTYLDKVIPQHPDSLIVAVDFLLERAPDSTELYKYLLWEITQKYEQSKIMGFDAVFTHVALNYFKEGRTSDINEQVIKNIVERGEILKNLLIGKKAPNLVMQDSTRKPRQLHNVDAKYTVLVFWDSECGHCKKVVPKLAKFYHENAEKYNLEVFAVSTDTSVASWKEFVNEHNLDWVNVFGYWGYTKNFHDLYDIYSTPVIYLLDKDKAIIGKRISVPQIEEIILNEEKKD